MTRKALSLFLAVSLLVWPQALSAQSVADPEVAKGIKQVEDGDYDTAILTLDNAARRLASDPAKTRDLAQAYVYLGIAYVGKGHEAAAKAKFREALGQMKDISLSPEKFPPKVINIFEEAKEEAAKAPAPAPAVQKKGGGGKTLLIVGGVVAAGGAVALAAGGGGASAGPKDRQPAVMFDFVLTQEQYSKEYDIFVNSPGTLDATVTWTEAAAHLAMYLYDSDTGQNVAEGGQTGNTQARLTANVSAKKYTIGVFHAGDSQGSASFHLVIRFP